LLVFFEPIFINSIWLHWRRMEHPDLAGLLYGKSLLSFNYVLQFVFCN
jgi:hypothetical protein